MAKQAKMISCKHCGAEIAASAKVCPHCGGKNRQSLFKRVWFWILIAGIVIAAVSCGGDNGDAGETKKIGEVSATQSNQLKENSEEQKNTEVQTVYHVGDILHDGDMDIVYAASGDYVSENQFSQPAEGKKFIFLKFAFLNTSDRSDSCISSFSFTCYADGYAADSYYGGDEDISATLSAGRSTMGCVYFEVPENAKEIEVEYETNAFMSKKIKFVYEGNLDSGYTLEKNATATEGALKPGDSLTGATLNIQYLSCIEDHSDNPFIVPKDGCRYITCEFEFENVSSSDVTVTSFSFDCFADGVSCDAAYFRDDNLSATLSAGRKAKGTVTFEVPLDAKIVEVEYLTNYWTSNRVVFDASVA